MATRPNRLFDALMWGIVILLAGFVIWFTWFKYPPEDLKPIENVAKEMTNDAK